MIGRRITDLSSNKDVFEAEVGVYSSALKASGYNYELQYTEKTIPKKKSRRRNMIWFNPPWNDEVRTNLANKFLSMIDRHFPKGSALGKHFNISTAKVSYSSMPNMARVSWGTTRRWLGHLPAWRPRAATVDRNPARWTGSAIPPTLSTGALWRPLATPSSTSDSRINPKFFLVISSSVPTTVHWALFRTQDPASNHKHMYVYQWEKVCLSVRLSFCFLGFLVFNDLSTNASINYFSHMFV